MATKPTTTKKVKKLDTEKTKVSFQRHDKDTGSPEVQILLLTEEITLLQSHLQSNKKDYDAKRSLLKKVAKRRRLLKYLKTKNIETYNMVSKKVDIKV